jgi:AraC family transcriptional activator of pobA
MCLASRPVSVPARPGYLTTVVRRKTGRSLQRWITERRMAEARRLLRETDLTIEDIAAKVGYRQPSFFIRHFRRDHTVTPAVWRRQTRASTRPRAASHRP